MTLCVQHCSGVTLLHHQCVLDATSSVVSQILDQCTLFRCLPAGSRGRLGQRQRHWGDGGSPSMPG